MDDKENLENINSNIDDWRWRMAKKLAFAFDAERMHELAIFLLKKISQLRISNLFSKDIAFDPLLRREFMGLKFPNPVGLAAGFDVDGECITALQALGFGFIEVGGITLLPQSGNPKPRIFRIPHEKAIINRLNFYNKGVYNLRKNLSYFRNRHKISVPIGINLGKSNTSLLEDVPNEYVKTFKEIYDVADYVTINVSCPNTQGLGKYQTAHSLAKLLDALCNFNETLSKRVPLLLKLGPDLTNEEAVASAEIALDYRLAGLVISNTTIKRSELISSIDYGPGGLSGQPLFDASTQLLRCVAKDYGKNLVCIGAGGIMDGAKALEKFNAGAHLLQVYTGFIYGGPNFINHLLYYIRQHLV